MKGGVLSPLHSAGGGGTTSNTSSHYVHVTEDWLKLPVSVGEISEQQEEEDVLPRKSIKDKGAN